MDRTRAVSSPPATGRRRGHRRPSAAARLMARVGIAAVLAFTSVACKQAGDGGRERSARGPVGTAALAASGASAYPSVTVMAETLSTNGMPCVLSGAPVHDAIGTETGTCVLGGDQAILRVWADPAWFGQFLASPDATSGLVAVGANWSVNVPTATTAAKVADLLLGVQPGAPVPGTPTNVATLPETTTTAVPEPAPTEPTSTEPTSTEPAAEPAPTEPAAEPVPAESSTEPAPVDPGAPASTEPAVGPAPTDTQPPPAPAALASPPFPSAAETAAERRVVAPAPAAPPPAPAPAFQAAPDAAPAQQVVEPARGVVGTGGVALRSRRLSDPSGGSRPRPEHGSVNGSGSCRGGGSARRGR